MSEAYTMHPADIKALIKKAGKSQSEIARCLPGRKGQTLTVGSVYLVIEGASKSARIAKYISDLVNVPVSQLWPGKYPDIEFLEAFASNNQDRRPQAKKGAHA